jgi:penicillin-binding protein 1A
MSLAGKSGTTTKDVDIWFVGFSPYFIGGVWGGCDENQPLIDNASGEYNGGSGFHKDIWRKIMQRVHEGLPDIGFEQPEGIVQEKVCRKSGMLPSRGCYNDYRGSAVITEYFAEGTVPAEHCELHYRSGGIRVPDDEDYGTDDGYSSRAASAASQEETTAAETSASVEVQPETREYGPSGAPSGVIEAPVVIVD